MSAFFKKIRFYDKIQSIPPTSAANAGNYGAAVVRSYGKASVGSNGVAIALGNGAMVSGKTGSLLVLAEYDDEGKIVRSRSFVVDGLKVKADTFYTLENGKRIVVKEA